MRLPLFAMLAKSKFLVQVEGEKESGWGVVRESGSVGGKLAGQC